MEYEIKKLHSVKLAQVDKKTPRFESDQNDELEKRLTTLEQKFKNMHHK
jgi:hypothetical protein